VALCFERINDRFLVALQVIRLSIRLDTVLDGSLGESDTEGDALEHVTATDKVGGCTGLWLHEALICVSQWLAPPACE